MNVSVDSHIRIEKRHERIFRLADRLDKHVLYRLVHELLDLSLLPGQRQGHNPTDVHIRPVNVHVQFELFADGLDVLEAFLEVGTRAADPDLNFVFDESGGKFAEGTNDALERRRDLVRCLAHGVFSGASTASG